jgi:hypothetical protein
MDVKAQKICELSFKIPLPTLLLGIISSPSAKLPTTFSSAGHHCNLTLVKLNVNK